MADTNTFRKRSNRNGSRHVGRERAVRHARRTRTRPKFYFLTMLPYPSGDLHIGHWYAMTPSDAAARYLRMRGYNVFFPIGFDAFGLPAENAAIKHGTHPYKWTMANIERMRGQLRSMGAMWAWDHEAVSCDPRVLRVDAVVLPEAVRPRPGLSQVRAGGLLPEVQHHAGARTGVGRRPALRALRHAGDQERAGTVVLQDHGLRRRAAALSTASTGPSASARCRPTGSAAARAPRWLLQDQESWRTT